MDVLCPLHYKKVPAVSSLTVNSITLRYFFQGSQYTGMAWGSPKVNKSEKTVQANAKFNLRICKRQNGIYNTVFLSIQTR